MLLGYLHLQDQDKLPGFLRRSYHLQPYLLLSPQECEAHEYRAPRPFYLDLPLFGYTRFPSTFSMTVCGCYQQTIVLNAKYLLDFTTPLLPRSSTYPSGGCRSLTQSVNRLEIALERRWEMSAGNRRYSRDIDSVFFNIQPDLRAQCLLNHQIDLTT